jgi:hypothetical protein
MTNNNEPTESTAELDAKHKEMLAKVLDNKEEFTELFRNLTLVYITMDDDKIVGMPKCTFNLVMQVFAFAMATALKEKRLEDERLARVRASN